MSSKAATLLCASYRRKLAWGGVEFNREEGLQNCINSIYSRRTEDERADLYARLVDGGFCGTAGMTSRRLIATTHIRSWDIARARGKIPVRTEAKKEFTL